MDVRTGLASASDVICCTVHHAIDLADGWLLVKRDLRLEAVTGLHPAPANADYNGTSEPDHAEPDPRAAVADADHAAPHTVDNVEKRVGVGQSLQPVWQCINGIERA